MSARLDNPELIRQAEFLKDAGLPNPAIAKQLGVSRETVWDWLAPGQQQRRERQRDRARERYATEPDFRKEKIAAARRGEKKMKSKPLGRAKRCLITCRAAARKLGFTPCTTPAEVVAEALVKQDYCCAICSVHDSDSRLAMDHDHATGVFRGWLCTSCNNGLGRFKDDRTLLRVAAEYLRA